jgi:hypothetical protein
MKPNTQPFCSEEPEFDESYFGRFEEFRAVADPFKAFFTNRRIREMQAMLERVSQEEAAHFQQTGQKHMQRSPAEIREIRTA